MMNQKKIPLPIDLVLGVTYWCNSRCIMCDIWKMKPKNEYQAKDLRILPPSFRDINISGGEPFLRNDLPEIISVVKERCPKSRIIISSNGFLSDHIAKMTKEILKIDPNIGIGISIDGFESMHETVRRIPNGYKKCIQTISLLQGLGINNLRIGFTIVDENVSHLVKMHDVAKSLGIDFTLAYAQSSDHYFGGIRMSHQRSYLDLEQELNELIRRQLSSVHPKQWLRAYFSYGIREFAKTRLSPLTTRAGIDHCYIDSWGNAYPSVRDSICLGNIRSGQSFEEIWFSLKANKARRLIQKNPRNTWMICAARSSMRKNKTKIIWWIIKEQSKRILSAIKSGH